MDYLGKEIRNGRIDYTSYPNNLTCKFSCGLAAYQPTDLYLVNQNNEAVRIHFWDRTLNTEMTTFDCRAAGKTCDIIVSKTIGSTRLNSANVRVTMLKFYTAPWGDPFLLARDYNQQPNVIVVLELTSNITGRDVVKVNLQSTFSTLYYPPRP